MPDRDFSILPSTRVATLLDRYPELEEVLIKMVPAFKKLKSHILRKGIAKLASLGQAAAIAGMPVKEFINKLRATVGQGPVACEDSGRPDSYFLSQPESFEATKIVASIDETTIDPDKMPIATVLKRATILQPGEILELVTTILPAPGIEIMKRKGLLVWSVRQAPELIRTYVSKHWH